jgi:hypothetical protein
VETDEAIVFEWFDYEEQNCSDDTGKIGKRSGYVWLQTGVDSGG